MTDEKTQEPRRFLLFEFGPEGMKFQHENVTPFELLACGEIVRMEGEAGWMMQKQAALQAGGLVAVRGTLGDHLRKRRD